jgi:hypothetical protein
MNDQESKTRLAEIAALTDRICAEKLTAGYRDLAEKMIHAPPLTESHPMLYVG